MTQTTAAPAPPDPAKKVRLVLWILLGVIVTAGVIWYAVYREPQESTRVNQAELDYIAAGGGFARDRMVQTPLSWTNILRVARLRPILTISLAQFCGNTVLTFFLIDFVNYLATQRQMGWPCRVYHPQLLTARTFRVSSRFEKHLIFYQAYSERIEILRVVHGSQDLAALFDKEGID